MRIASSLLLFALSFISVIAQAETLYINDEVYVPLRSGPSSQHRILHKGLRSGTALETLPTDAGTPEGWVHVRVNSELTGWLPEQYLTSTPTAARQLKAAQDARQKAEQALSSVRNELNETQSRLQELEKNLASTEAEKQQTSMELSRIRSISSGAIEMDQKYQRLLEEHELLQTSNDALNAENTSLKADRRFSYMFNGAVLVLIGMLAAVIIPRLKPPKRNSEWVN